MKLQIKPTSEQINQWITRFVPSKDLFFIEDQHLEIFKDVLKGVLIIPKEEFVNHSSYQQIEFVNSYMYWTLSKRITFVIVANADWLSNLPSPIRKQLLELQLEMTTGLTIPLSILETVDWIPEEFIVTRNRNSNAFFNHPTVADEQQFVLLRAGLWQSLPQEIQTNIVTAYAKGVDDWESYAIPDDMPLHLKAFANQFTTIAGSNCLAATLYAMNEESWILEEWVHPETFLTILAQYEYVLVQDDMQNGDVITWVNANQVVQHASYSIGNGLYFNKSGQSFFEPWKIVRFNEINMMLENCEVQVYRKINSL